MSQSTSPAVRVLRLVSFAYMLVSLLLALLSLLGMSTVTQNTVTWGPLLTAGFVAVQGILVWAFLTVVADIADDVRAMRSR